MTEQLPQASGDSPVAVVDAHTHVFAPEVVQGREGFFGRDLWFEHLYANPKALLITADELLASMDAAGIAQAVVCGFPWRDPGICREHNDYMAEACAASGGRLAWLATVSPLSGEQAAREAERAFALGACGLGELNADAQGFDLREPAPLRPTVEACLAADRPLMLHATEPVGHTYPGKGTATPDRLLAFLEAFPELRVVAAHWGGGLPFYELMPEVRQAAARVVYDSAASTYLYRFEIFRIVLDLVGPERVMFASDYPILRQDRFLRRVQQTPWRDPEEERLVLGETARRVYGLAPVDETP
ncbi:MAG TPA: amidohydrolase family protein [Thermomicrobiales bacterium]